MHPIFQIRISQNTKCADMPGFPRPGHIYNIACWCCDTYRYSVIHLLKDVHACVYVHILAVYNTHDH